MIRQIPAERPLPDKERVLERVLADADQLPARKNWLLPVAAAASIAVIAAGAISVPSLLKSDDRGPATGVSTTPSAIKSSQRGGGSISIDRGKLTAAEATAFGTECIKWVGAKDKPGQHFHDAPLDWPGAGAKAEQIMHATRIVSDTAGKSEDWTVAVRTGDRIYSCVGRITRKDSDGQVVRDYAFGGFGKNYPDGLSGAGDSVTLTGSQSTARVGTDRWVVAPPTAAKFQRRIVLNGKPAPWFSSDVVDGLGYVRGSSAQKLIVGDKVRIESRLLDHDGRQVGKLLVQAFTVVPDRHGVDLEPENR